MNTKKREDLMNETINPRVEDLADLAVTDEQARQAKGGEGSTSGGSRIKGHHHVTLQILDSDFEES
jgi:hypothetical protein